MSLNEIDPERMDVTCKCWGFWDEGPPCRCRIDQCERKALWFKGWLHRQYRLSDREWQKLQKKTPYGAWLLGMSDAEWQACWQEEWDRRTLLRPAADPGFHLLRAANGPVWISRRYLLRPLQGRSSAYSVTKDYGALWR